MSKFEGMVGPLASVVVPTLNREESLRRFLDGALQQTYEEYEIVIVDQSDGEPSEGLREQLARGVDRIRYFHIPRCGSPRARNFGAVQARGEILISCDDDIVVPPRWVAAHAANYADVSVGAVAGRVASPLDDQPYDGQGMGRVNWRTGEMGNNFAADFRTDYVWLAEEGTLGEAYNMCAGGGGIVEVIA